VGLGVAEVCGTGHGEVTGRTGGRRAKPRIIPVRGRIPIHAAMRTGGARNATSAPIAPSLHEVLTRRAGGFVSDRGPKMRSGPRCLVGGPSPCTQITSAVT